jgi:hypothetical protein
VRPRIEGNEAALYQVRKQLFCSIPIAGQAVAHHQRPAAANGLVVESNVIVLENRHR